MQDIVILSAVRTPIGAFQGAFRSVPVHVLGSRALEGAIERIQNKTYEKGRDGAVTRWPPYLGFGPEDARR